MIACIGVSLFVKPEAVIVIRRIIQPFSNTFRKNVKSGWFITFDSVSVILLDNMVGHNNCGKDRKALVCIQGSVVIVSVNSSNFNFISRFDLVA